MPIQGSSLSLHGLCSLNCESLEPQADGITCLGAVIGTFPFLPPQTGSPGIISGSGLDAAISAHRSGRSCLSTLPSPKLKRMGDSNNQTEESKQNIFAIQRLNCGFVPSSCPLRVSCLAPRGINRKGEIVICAGLCAVTLLSALSSPIFPH